MTLLSCLFLFPLFVPAAGGPVVAPRAAPVALRGDGGGARTAADALGAASRIKRSAAGKKDAERLEIMNRAAAAYEQVAKDFVGDAPTAAQANFRAGEIYRTIKRAEDAHRCFEGAAAAAAAPEWSARAFLELGHIARRMKRLQEAYETYGKVLAIVPQQRSQCVDALTWQGRVLVDQKREQEGHALLLSIGTRFPDFPVDDVRNVDDVAVDWIRAGRVDEATTLVQDCVERHTRQGPDGKEPPAALLRALDHMKSRELLAAHGEGGDGAKMKKKGH